MTQDIVRRAGEGAAAWALLAAAAILAAGCGGGHGDDGDAQVDGDAQQDGGDRDAADGEGEGISPDAPDGDAPGDVPVEEGCGNGVLEEGEECDNGPYNSDTMPNACRTDCMPARCGDAVTDAGECCDDGNGVDDDACTSACVCSTCGDGEVQLPEQCDDGNGSDTDGCLSSCIVAFCGDGHVREGSEQCDDGNLDTTDDCPTTCEDARCGDGFLHSGVEQCDDGNTLPDDGCSPDCAVPCDDSSDCADGDPCTQDLCDPSFHTCVFPADPAMEGQVCDVGDLCTGIGTCMGGACTYSDPLDCDDHQECTTDRCDSHDGCVNSAAGEGTPCEDGFFCTVGDACTWGGICNGPLGAACADGNPCTLDVCDEDTDTCSHPAPEYRSVLCGEGSGGHTFGSPSEYNGITCPDGPHAASNPDAVFQVEVPSAGTLTVTLNMERTDPGTEVYILTDACSVSSCIAMSSGSAAASAAAGIYYIVVDSPGAYDFGVSCP